jgi:aryl-alcohol dehydrogenase (NADP+)
LKPSTSIPPIRTRAAWLLHQSGVTAPISGATKLIQLEEAVAALEIQLAEDEIKLLGQPYVPHPVLGHS